jgi:transcriptional regulator with GAF, ATPase, and Fis domain
MTAFEGFAPATPWWSRQTDDGVDDLLRRGLDWLERVVPYDLATILTIEDGAELVVRCARGRLANERVRGHKLALAAFPTVCEALETRRARAFTEDDHAHGDGDPFDGVLDLAPGHACMVVPLCAANMTIGVLTLDRERCEPYAANTVTLAEVYGQVLALAIHNAQRGSSLARLHARDRQHVRLLETLLLGEGPEAFESSEDPAMRRTVARAKQAAITDTPVLIRGQRDSGKGRLARAIHRWSKRAGEPFVIVDCAESPDLERELFGDADMAGRFWLAHGGTLFLTNIEALPLALQERLEATAADASTRRGWPDVRLMAGTTTDLESSVEAKAFSLALYERLSVFRVEMPASAEAVTVVDGSGRGESGRQVERPKTLIEVQRDHIAAVLKLAGGRIYGANGAAALLGLKPSTLQSKMKKLGLSRESSE